jgi:two-component system nitrogen regulation sensor histidine kinase NtrY
MRLSTRIRLTVATAAIAAFVAAFLALHVGRALDMPEPAVWALAMLATIPFVLWSAARMARYVTHALDGLEDGLRAFRDADFSMRLAAPERDEVTSVKRLYNDVADVLRAQRIDVYQKELLLDTILQRTPMAVTLVDAGGRVVYSNSAARELLASGRRLDGIRFAAIVESITSPMREALLSDGDAIVTVRTAEQDETFHLSQRTFRLNTLEHRLILIERLTSELRRQEVAVWKKAIRVINHELNNTIAPISSLFHSAKLAQAMPERRELLGEIYETIEERLAFLRTFLESYAQFARLPPPRRERTSWSDILADVRALYEFRVEGELAGLEGELAPEVIADRVQLQQVLINLVKNAHESGSAPDDITVTVQRTLDGTVLRVTDRGSGMSEEVLRQALVPFYTTKPAGSGLGLALCNEIIEAHGGRMRLQAVPGEGAVVTCWLPG